jgi:cytochrome c-type biogenesis protein
MLGTLAFALVAGALSLLSPCVLPVLPIVLAGASAESRFGPLALAGGLAISFAAIGIGMATVGFAIGLDGDTFRIGAAILMIVIGIVLVLPALQERASAAAGPFGDWVNRRFEHMSTGGAGGQFALGLVLGAVWSPCVGPTLGAASVMAARGENLASVAATMLVFGIGAAVPLILLARLPVRRFQEIRRWLVSGGRGGRMVAGFIVAGVGLAIVTGIDKQVETFLVEMSPDWLTRLTTSF